MNVFVMKSLCFSQGLCFAAGGGDALDEGALREEEKRNHGQCEDTGARHELRPFGAVTGHELLKAVSEGVSVVIVDVKQGAGEVVPCAEELKQGAGGERRLGQRQRYLPENASVAGALNTGCFRQLFG